MLHWKRTRLTEPKHVNNIVFDNAPIEFYMAHFVGIKTNLILGHSRTRRVCESVVRLSFEWQLLFIIVSIH